MKSGLIKVNSYPKVQNIINKARDEGIFVVEIDGIDIQNVESYLEAIESGFKLPIPINRKYYEEQKSISELYHLVWLKDYKGFALVIYNQAEFLKFYNKERDIIIKFWKHLSGAWWQESVHIWLSDEYMNLTGHGKSFDSAPKAFSVYLVE
jgi:hypothetical protein